MEQSNDNLLVNQEVSEYIAAQDSDINIIDTPQDNADSEARKTSGAVAISQHQSCCLQCGTLIQFSEDDDRKICTACSGEVAIRKINSLSRTAALLVAAVICIIPANILPITKASYFAGEQADTILSGIIYLWRDGSYPVALVVFFASFITPIFKICSLSYLCYTCHIKSTKNVMFRSKLYHFTELIGRWSMVDVFVVSLLSAMVQMGALATMNAGPGVIAFLLVVILSMTAAETFDSRLIWDEFNEQYRKQSK